MTDGSTQTGIKPVSLTAFYTCGIRARDASSARPIIGDRHAQALMSAEGAALAERMRSLRNPWNSVLARHWIIEQRLKAELAADPGLAIVHLGAGLDTRPFRLQGGRWLEIDEPALIAFKEARLAAASAPNPLTRLAVDFAAQPLAQALAPFREGARVLVVVEGVVMYLAQAELIATFAALAGLAPRVDLIYDEMSATFFRRVGQDTHERLAAHGAPFRVASQDPAAAWRQAGFRELARTSIPLTMTRLGIGAAPAWLLNSLLRWLRDGYQVVELARAG